jgi:hypothetical protein
MFFHPDCLPIFVGLLWQNIIAKRSGFALRLVDRIDLFFVGGAMSSRHIEALSRRRLLQLRRI